MIRNFIAGAAWGLVVAGAVLGVISQVAPMPAVPQVGAGTANEGLAPPDTVSIVPKVPVVTAMGAKPAEQAETEVPAETAVPDATAQTAAPSKPDQVMPKADSVSPTPAINSDVPALLPPKPPAAVAVMPKPAVIDGSDAPPSADQPAQGLPAPGLPAPGLPAQSSGDDQLALGDAADVPVAPVSPPPAIPAAPLALVTPDAAAPDQPAVARPAAQDAGPAVISPAELSQTDTVDAVPKAADAPPTLPLRPPAEPLLTAPPGIKANPAPATIAPDGVTPGGPVTGADGLPQILGDTPGTSPANDAAKPDASILEPATPPAPPPGPIARDQPSTFAPDGSMMAIGKDVKTGRLPRIGDQAGQGTAPDVPQMLPPVQEFAQSFANPAGKPLFAIILRDTGGTDVDRTTLAALPFPVSFVVDPLAPDAAKTAAIYRAAGQEVIMLASGIPAGAQASDLEQTFQSLGTALPQAVAVMDLAMGGFQDNRPLATLVVPIIKSQGRGLITFNRGLNAADQVARREDVPSATIFRQLDAEGEDPPLIRRYLDRAAFKAAQEGRVVVLGDTKAVTIAALMEWTVEGRAASVTLAPVTAVLSVD